MPSYDHSNPNDFKIIKVPMSDFQFGVYEEARIQERKLEEANKKKNPRKPKREHKETNYIVIVLQHIVYFHARFVILYSLNQT